MVNPVRTWPASNSSEPMVHASVSILNKVGLKAGVRALPVFSLSRLRVSSPGEPRLVHAELFQDAREIRSAASSSFIRKCSISMS